MAFTENQLDQTIDPASTDRTVQFITMIPGPTVTDIYAIGIMAPYAGKCGWTQVPNGSTPAQAIALVQQTLS